MKMKTRNFKTDCSNSVFCYSPLFLDQDHRGYVSLRWYISITSFLSVLQCYIICKVEMGLFGQNLHLSQKLPEALKLPKTYTQ